MHWLCCSFLIFSIAADVGAEASMQKMAAAPQTQPAPEAIATGVIGVEEPLGVAFAADGSLLVAAGDEGIVAFDSATRTRTRVIATGAPDAFFAAIAVAPDGSIFAIDDRASRVVHLSRAGEVLAQFGEVRGARGVAVSEDGARIAIADTGNDRVLIFSRAAVDGTATAGGGAAPSPAREPAALQVIGSRGTRNGEFRAPRAVAFDPAGRLFVADSDNHRIQRFSRDGRFEAVFGTRGTMPGQFERPMALLASEDTLLVVDHFNHRVQRIDEDGGFRTLWGMHAVVPREADGRIHYPVSIAVDGPRGIVAVAEPFERRVQMFRRSMEGEQVPMQPPPPAREGVSSHFGEGVAVDGTLLALWEPEASAIVIFDLRRERPAHVTTFGSPGRRVHEIGRVVAIAVDEPSERVWILDAGNDRIVEWTLRRDPQEDLRFDPFMGGVTRAVDFAALGRSTATIDGGPARVDPIAMARAPGALLMLDALRGRVIRLDDRSLEPIAILPSADMGFPRDPIAIAVSPDGSRMAMLDGHDPARLAAIVPLRGEGNTRVVPRPAVIQRPKGIAWLTDEVLVVTTGDDRLVIATLDGQVIASPALHGIDDGMLWHPRGVAAATDGSFFVVDWGNHRVQRFDANGLWLSRFGIGRSALRPRLPDALPAMILAKRGETLPVRVSPATEQGPFPRALASRDRSVQLTWKPVNEHGAALTSIPLRDPFFLRVVIAPTRHEGDADNVPAATSEIAASSDSIGLDIDAAMPHHGHGMNLAPTVRAIEGSGDLLVGPMLFHMPGAWEIYFDRRENGRLARLQDEIIMGEEK